VKETEKEKEKGWERGSEVVIPGNETEKGIGIGKLESERGREILEIVETYVIVI
jgi:hypothetical protein